MYKIEEFGSIYFYDVDFTYIEQSNILYVFDALRYVDKKNLSQSCRPVLTPHWNNKDFILNYLFWFEPTDLKQIDKNVILSKYHSMDFFHSIKCDFIPNFSCLNCNYIYKNVLVVDQNTIYPNNFNIGYKKLDYIRKNNKYLRCTKCNNKFNRLIMHIFD